MKEIKAWVARDEDGLLYLIFGRKPEKTAHSWYNWSKDYYKLDPDNKMETYEFGILYINEEDKFQMQDINSASDFMPDETNDSAVYMKDHTPIPIGVKPVKYDEENAE